MHNGSVVPLPAQSTLQRQLDALEARLVAAPEEIEAALHDLVSQAERAGDIQAQGRALVILGGSLFHQRRFPEVVRKNELALELARRTGDRGLESRALDGLGIGKQKMGLYGQAFEHYTQSLQLSRTLRDHLSVVRTLSHLAYLYRVHRQFEQAMTLLAEAQDLLLRHRHPRYALAVSGNLVWTHIDAGNYQQALAITHLFLPEALDQPGMKYAVPFYCAQAICYLRLKRLPEALTCATRAMQEAERQLDSDADTVSLVTMAEVLCAMNEFSRAEELLHRALGRAELGGSEMARANVRAKLAQVYAGLGNQQRAFAYARHFFEVQEQCRDGSDDPLGMVRFPPPAR